MPNPRKHREPPSDIDWSTIDFVVGTREDVTFTGIHRPCARCGQAVFTSRRYTIEVALVCEYCALELVEEDRKSGKSQDDALPFTTSGWSDPWRRAPAPSPRRRARKLAAPPKPDRRDKPATE